MMGRRSMWAALLAQLLLLRIVLAAVSFTNADYYVYPSVPFTLTWTDARGPVNITLMNGPDEYLKEVLLVVAAFEGADEYTWTPPPTVPPDSYILRIEDGGSTDYSPRFVYPGPVLTTTATRSQTSTSTSTLPAATASTSTAQPPEQNKELLSTPAKAVIATLGSLLIVILLALLWYCIARRRRRLREAERAAAEVSHELPLSPRSDAETLHIHGNNVMMMKVEGQEGNVVELPVRGWGEMVELSAESDRKPRVKG